MCLKTHLHQSRKPVTHSLWCLIALFHLFDCFSYIFALGKVTLGMRQYRNEINKQTRLHLRGSPALGTCVEDITWSTHNPSIVKNLHEHIPFSRELPAVQSPLTASTQAICRKHLHQQHHSQLLQLQSSREWWNQRGASLGHHSPSSLTSIRDPTQPPAETSSHYCHLANRTEHPVQQQQPKAQFLTQSQQASQPASYLNS